MPTYQITSRPFNLEISFPWERGIFIRVRILSQDMIELQDYQRSMPPGLLRPYSGFLTTIKAIIHKAMTAP